ncbi:MAG: hypothetical protein B6242_17125 [Anaerolineaceae bacterium 4572_78]|nr:MAG: hypothetical protein B6242_17125 [Anaerolineaceae bacterium 4572_78]
MSPGKTFILLFLFASSIAIIFVNILISLIPLLLFVIVIFLMPGYKQPDLKEHEGVISVPCGTCKGIGSTMFSGWLKVFFQCSSCGGSGKIAVRCKGKCANCGGTGMVFGILTCNRCIGGHVHAIK